MMFRGFPKEEKLGMRRGKLAGKECLGLMDECLAYDENLSERFDSSFSSAVN